MTDTTMSDEELAKELHSAFWDSLAMPMSNRWDRCSKEGKEAWVAVANLARSLLSASPAPVACEPLSDDELAELAHTYSTPREAAEVAAYQQRAKLRPVVLPTREEIAQAAETAIGDNLMWKPHQRKDPKYAVADAILAILAKREPAQPVPPLVEFARATRALRERAEKAERELAECHAQLEDSPVTRSEFAALAARVSALEMAPCCLPYRHKPVTVAPTAAQPERCRYPGCNLIVNGERGYCIGHAVDTETMPKCPECGEMMHAPDGGDEKCWECLRPKDDTCTRRAVAVCSACTWAYCADHLPKAGG